MIQELLHKFVDFLAANDFPTLLEAFRHLSWKAVAMSPYTWLILLPLFTVLVWTKRFKFLVSIGSFFVFLYLLQTTLPAVDGKIPLHDLLVFLGGTLGLIGINVYLIFIKE